jgi:4-hydroxythreonine-4-phosphate dehydrogenase
MALPTLAITMGDPAGIGPEIVAKALPEAFRVCRPVLIGIKEGFVDAAMACGLEDIARQIGRSIPVETPERLSEHAGAPKPGEAGEAPRMGYDLAFRGMAQAAFVRMAVELAMVADVDAVVTAPITKSALHKAGIHYPGHTEILGDLTGTQTPVMMLIGETLRVVPLTTHCPIREVPDMLTRKLVEEKIRVIDKDMQRYFGMAKARIALCALNPHGGESGLFGKEEIEILAPAVVRLRSEGINISGPHPADTIFVKAVKGEYDVVATPTHDQAMIPIKLLHFDKGVNITLGLPIIRTSPDHGTALDIAGKYSADPTSMITAIKTAADMVQKKRING